MDGKIFILVAVLMLNFGLNTAQSHKSGYCPLRNSVYKCKPRCMGDFDCASGNKCCPNVCGSRSCASTSPVSTGGNNGYKGSYSPKENSSYCGGSKCRPYEKCIKDRYTKRPKCVPT